MHRIAEEPLVLNYAETVAKAEARMRAGNAYYAVVTKSGKPYGILDSKILAHRRFGTPEKAQIGKFASRVTPMEGSVEDLAHEFLSKDHDAAPVIVDGKLMIATKLGVLGFLKDRPAFRKAKASDVMRHPLCITPAASINSAFSIMRDRGIARLPVVSEDDKVEGVIDSLCIIKVDRTKTRRSKGERAGESLDAGKAYATSIMDKSFPYASSNDRVSAVISQMEKLGKDYALILDNRRISGIVTARSMLKLLGEPVQGTYVAVPGIQDEDSFQKEQVNKEIEAFVGKIGKLFTIDRLIIQVNKRDAEGKRARYTVHARLVTEAKDGLFFAQTGRWGLVEAVSDALGKLEKEALKKKRKA